MNIFKKKLRSRAGASMIIAMVFMLFCSFIGGTVLASATANAQRVAQMAEQQDFLLERSAALLASDQLQLGEGKYLRLSVADSERLIEEMQKGNGGVFDPTGRTGTQRVITFQVNTNLPALTDMHRLVLETTVYRFLREYAPGTYDELNFVNFPGGIDSLDDFIFSYSMPSAESNNYEIEGSLQLTAAVRNSSGVSIPTHTVNFTSGRGENIFDFFVYFGDASQVKMTLNAYSGFTNPVPIPSPTQDGNLPGVSGSTGYIRVTDDITQHTISWEDPLIEKGGA